MSDYLGDFNILGVSGAEIMKVFRIFRPGKNILKIKRCNISNRFGKYV